MDMINGLRSTASFSQTLLRECDNRAYVTAGNAMNLSIDPRFSRRSWGNSAAQPRSDAAVTVRHKARIDLTTIRRKVVSPISAFRQEGLRVKGNHGFSFSDGLRPAQTQTARSGQRCDAVPHSKIELYGSLKSPACSCVSIPLPASS